MLIEKAPVKSEVAIPNKTDAFMYQSLYQTVNKNTMNEEETIHNFINAIIEQAVKDYRRALKRPNDDESQRTIREVERFFRGDWFAFLTDVDGEYLIAKIKKEVATNGRNSQQKQNGKYWEV